MDGIYTLADPTSAVAAINMNDEFNFFGKKTYLWGRSFASFPQISDAPVQKEIAVPEPEPVVEEEGSWWGNLGIGILATAALGGLAVLAFGAATVATGGAALVFVGVCLAGAAAGAATVTTVAAYEDYKSGHTRTTSEFLSQLTAGAIKGATTSAMLYGMWHGIPAASQWLGGDLAMLFSGSVLSTLNFTKLSAGAGYLLMAAQGLRNSSEIVSIASGYNWVLENIFGGNVENYNDTTALMDGISFQVVMVGLVNYLNRPKTGTEKGVVDYMDGEVRLNGKEYDPKKLKQLENYLRKRGIELKVGDQFLPPGKAGGFDPVSGKLYLRSNPTQYEVWHEVSHYIQYQQLGKEAYLNLPRTTGVEMDMSLFNAPEQFVYDMLSNPKRWGMLSYEEQLHANWYINNYGGFN